MHTLKKTAVAAALAAAFAAIAGPAQAAIVTGATGPGEMFLNVWDVANAKSYGLDLGITTTQFLADPSQILNFDLTTDSNYSGFLGNTSLIWNIAGAMGCIDCNIDEFGIYVTSNDPKAAVLPSPPRDYTYPGNASVNVSTHAQALNGIESNPTANGAGNGSSVATAGDGGAYFGNGWGSNLAGGVDFNVSGSINDPIHFYHWGSDSNGMLAITTFANDWTLTDSGMLCYGGTACNAQSTVPVPAAVWLFGSGLIGLVGVARRKMA